MRPIYNKYVPKMTEEQRFEMVKLYLSSNLSMKQVANQYEISDVNVNYWVKKLKEKVLEVLENEQQEH